MFLFIKLLAVDCRKGLAKISLKLISGSCYLPHPDKEETEGRMLTSFVWMNKQLADGVGGWTDLGFDAGQFARELRYNSQAAVRNQNYCQYSILNSRELCNENKAIANKPLY
ncbi:protein-serine,threonine phosphatase [Sarracenia purpurea var. burkii]